MEENKIVYKPHCGKCGFPIDTSEYEIAWQNVYDNIHIPDKMLAGKVATNIYPYKCAHCGVPFVSIEISMPKQLNDVFLG
jgi:ribosomal protein L37E